MTNLIIVLLVIQLLFIVIFNYELFVLIKRKKKAKNLIASLDRDILKLARIRNHLHEQNGELLEQILKQSNSDAKQIYLTIVDKGM